jgi:hypothetical protein
MLFAVCGQNIRKVKKKNYKDGDLASISTQVTELDFGDELNPLLPPLALWPQPITRAKPKVYKRQNKK